MTVLAVSLVLNGNRPISAYVQVFAAFKLERLNRAVSKRDFVAILAIITA